jgi:hypothetical protein
MLFLSCRVLLHILLSVGKLMGPRFLHGFGSNWYLIIASEVRSGKKSWLMQNLIRSQTPTDGGGIDFVFAWVN